MQDDHKPEQQTLTVPIVTRDACRNLVRTVARFPMDVRRLGLEQDALEWLTWAGECLRLEVVDALAKSYQPDLPRYLLTEATDLFLEARKERLIAEGTPLPETTLDPSSHWWVRFAVQFQLESWVESSPAAWDLASFALILHTVNAWEFYEKRMGKGSVAEIRRATGLSGAGLGAISSDEFLSTVGPLFRDELAPGLAKRFVREVMLPPGVSIDDVDAYFGFRLRWDKAPMPEAGGLPVT
jgi:hypothetical protein